MDYETCVREALKSQENGRLDNAQFWATMTVAAAIREGVAKICHDLSD